MFFVLGFDGLSSSMAMFFCSDECRSLEFIVNINVFERSRQNLNLKSQSISYKKMKTFIDV